MNGAASLPRYRDGLGASRYSQFREDAGNVVADGFLGESETLGDLRVGQLLIGSPTFVSSDCAVQRLDRHRLLSAAHVESVDWLTDWVYPGAIRTLVESVHDAFDAARTGLLVMMAFAVVVEILRIVGSLAGRLVAVVVITTLAAALWVYGSEIAQLVAE